MARTHHHILLTVAIRCQHQLVHLRLPCGGNSTPRIATTPEQPSNPSNSRTKATSSNQRKAKSAITLIGRHCIYYTLSYKIRLHDLDIAFEELLKALQGEMKVNVALTSFKAG